MKHRRVALLIALVVLSLLAVRQASGQAAPEEAYGPYNAIFLPDGPGLIKPLAPPPPLDPRYKGPQPPDPLTDGAAQWTLAFWFHPSEPLSGAVLLAGFGDPTGYDARFIGVENNHLGLWLGNAPGAGHLFTGTMPLARGDWHFAAAVSDGQHVTLYADGEPVTAWPLRQGTIAAQIQIAPAPRPSQSTEKHLAPAKLRRCSISGRTSVFPRMKKPRRIGAYKPVARPA